MQRFHVHWTNTIFRHYTADVTSYWQKQAIADNLRPQRSKLVGILVESISVHWDLLPPIRVAIPVLDGGSHYIMLGFAMRMEKSLLLR